MKPQQLQSMLQQTLDDYRLSRGEQTALRRILEHVGPSEASLAVYRSIAFQLAQEAVREGDPRLIVNWLEDVCKVLTSGTGTRETRAEALFSPDDDCPQRLASLLAAAKQTVDICVFTITDDRITRAIEHAHQRKVAVRVITDDEKAFDRGSDVARLRESGIDVRCDQTEHHMHHKFAVFDGLSLVTGSYNWTRSADQHNQENYVIVDDLRLVHRFQLVFEQLWQKFA